MRRREEARAVGDGRRGAGGARVLRAEAGAHAEVGPRGACVGGAAAAREELPGGEAEGEEDDCGYGDADDERGVRGGLGCDFAVRRTVGKRIVREV